MIASAGDAEGGKEGSGWMGQARSSMPRPMGMGGRIEPAEPEPPPAHSIGRVGEDTMSRGG